MAALLLDVNALLALAWPNHQFHAEVTKRLGTRERWATCALTQLGFVRLSSNPAAVGVRKTPREALALLESLLADRSHVFLATLPSVASLRPALQVIVGHQQVVDAYLLALAGHHETTLVTFDRRMAALPAQAGSIEVLP